MENSKERFKKLRETGDPDLRDALVAEFTGLAEYLARRFAGRGEELNDLSQVALMGLVKAVDRFDPGREVEFSTYATHTISGELKRHFRDKGWDIRAPRRVQELYLKLGKASGPLTQKLGRTPSIEELASELDESSEAIIEAMEAGSSYTVGSLDKPVGEEGESLGTVIGEDDPDLLLAEQRMELKPLLEMLDERSRRIMVLRFYLGRTQSEIAEDLGISQMHVSRLIAKSLSQLRQEADK